MVKIIFWLSVIYLPLLANVHFILFKEIPDYNKHIRNIEFVKINSVYYDHWWPEWTYDVSKDSLIRELKNTYDVFSKSDKKNAELYLFLGDLAHYLYNLHQENYYQIAIDHYKKAIDLLPDDYRPYWFIANHYCLAAKQKESVVYFLKSEKRLPDNYPGEFWDEYARAMYLAAMPSHCLYAMDKSRNVYGRPGNFEENLGNVLKEKVEVLNSDSTYNFLDLWTGSIDSISVFTSRPFGIKFSVDSTWKIYFSKYDHHTAFADITPPGLINKNGQRITYSVAIIMKIAQQGETLESFLNNFCTKYDDIRTFKFSDKYDSLISYEIKNKNLYPHIGGAHIHLVGIERNCPAYPGLILEKPMIIPTGKEKELSIYRPANHKDRFCNTIYYALLLDTCEDIYEGSFKVFKDFFEHQLIIE